MLGRGKRRKGLVKGGAKRHHKVLRDNIKKTVIGRFARRWFHNWNNSWRFIK